MNETCHDFIVELVWAVSLSGPENQAVLEAISFAQATFPGGRGSGLRSLLSASRFCRITGNAAMTEPRAFC